MSFTLHNAVTINVLEKEKIYDGHVFLYYFLVVTLPKSKSHSEQKPFWTKIMSFRDQLKKMWKNLFWPPKKSWKCSMTRFCTIQKREHRSSSLIQVIYQQAGAGDMAVVSVSNGPPDQQEQVDEASSKFAYVTKWEEWLTNQRVVLPSRETLSG